VYPARRRVGGAVFDAGGMWSLTLTDIIQFIIMTVGMMLVLMPMSIVKAGGWDAFTSLLPAGYYRLSSIGLDTILVFFLIYFFGILIGGTSGSGCYRPQRQWRASLSWGRASIACCTA
ncbi:hypothetical protein J4732_21255, partial [Serratia marcescens]|nr:hypothetical protein [Serratia marcescens]